MKFYGTGIPGVDPSQLKGTLIVIEGGDGAGRSTQVQLLKDAIERLGFPTVEVGLKRSRLVGAELTEAMQRNVLCPRTMGLFYATDLADQLENTVIPSLRAGFVVIADRYIYTLIAREVVRGADPRWIRQVYGIALVPDLVFYLRVSPKVLAERSLQKNGVLNYWESGMDIQRSGDMHQCFIYYQNRLWQQFNQMKDEFQFIMINGNRSPETIHREIRGPVVALLTGEEEPDRTRHESGQPGSGDAHRTDRESESGLTEARSNGSGFDESEAGEAEPLR